MHELFILGGSHKTKTTPYHPESDGLVERFNRTLLMMLAMFAGEHKDDWDDLQPDLAEDVSSPYAVWVRDSLEVAFDQVRRHSGQAVI